MMEKRIGRKRKRSRRNRRLLIILAVILLLVLTTGGLVARYTTQNKREAQMLAADFYISSDYLEESGTTVNVSNWGDNNLEIKLYNHQKENLALISKEDITYEIEIQSNDKAWSIEKVTDFKDTDVTATDENTYVLDDNKGNQFGHTIKLKYDSEKLSDGTLSPVTVKVKTTAPYVKELSATFNLVSLVKPKYTIEDKGKYCLITIQTNDYFDHIDVEWDSEKFSPDNANDTYMPSDPWQDAGTVNAAGHRVESFKADAYHTYELIFIKKTDQPFSDVNNGVGATIPLY